MSSTRFNVQLSAPTYSFQITVPSDSTVSQLKDQITETCPGRPSRSGQRVIYKGRIIDDGSVVADVWNTGEPEYTIHVAVNPSAWSAQPPKVQTAPEASASTSRPPTPHASSPLQSPAAAYFAHTTPTPAYVPPSPPYAMALIHHLHVNALRVLCRLPPVPWWGFVTQDLPSARTFCKSTIEAAGGTWPSVFDQEYPPAQPGEGDGVQYSIAFSSSLPYLILQTPDATPTTPQRHALKVLEATLPLLNQTPLIQAQFLQQVHTTLQTHALVTARAAVHHNVPRPGVRIGHLGGAMQPLAQIQFRVLLAPLLMLAFRASLLLYIFSPSRRPMFAILIAGWVAWEALGAFRAAMAVPPGAARAAAARPAPVAAAAAPAAGANAPGGGVPVPAQAQANGAPAGVVDATLLGVNRDQDLVTRLANIDLAAEAAILAPGAAPAPPPPLSQRIKSFFTLLILSMHPAWWNRRRRALRNREGQLRTLYRQVEAEEQPAEQTPGGEQQPPREPPPQPPAGWAASYVERVRNTEWIDD